MASTAWENQSPQYVSLGRMHTAMRAALAKDLGSNMAAIAKQIERGRSSRNAWYFGDSPSGSRARGNETSEALSLSILTIEADRKPLLRRRRQKTSSGRSLLQGREGDNQTEIGQLRGRPALR